MEYIQSILVGKSGKTTKMASRHNISIAEELNSQLEPQPFTKILCMLDNKSNTTIEQFKRSTLFLSSSQWIDSRKFFTRGGAAIASGIFELFGQFSGKSGNEVHEDLLAWISENKNDVQTCVKIVLDHKGYNSSYWMMKMSHIQTPADDIAFYCLARMYQRHVIIHTSCFPWSTLSRQCKMSVEELIASSEIKLLLIRRANSQRYVIFVLLLYQAPGPV